MKKTTRKKISFTLLLITALPLFHILNVQLKQQKLYKEMRNKLHSAVLHTIILDKKEVHWVKSGKEIIINGRMFDVKSFSVHNSTITLTGLYDDDETVLVEQVRKDRQHNLPGTTQLSQLFQFLQTLYNSSCNGEIKFAIVLKKKYLNIQTAPLLSPFISRSIPPPKC